MNCTASVPTDAAVTWASLFQITVEVLDSLVKDTRVKICQKHPQIQAVGAFN